MAELDSFVRTDLGTFHLNEWLPALRHSITTPPSPFNFPPFFSLMDYCFSDLLESAGSCPKLSMLPAWPWSAAKSVWDQNLLQMYHRGKKGECWEKKWSKIKTTMALLLCCIRVIKFIFSSPPFLCKTNSRKIWPHNVCLVDTTAAKMHPEETSQPTSKPTCNRMFQHEHLALLTGIHTTCYAYRFESMSSYFIWLAFTLDRLGLDT